jgi:hypothetical protein
MHGMSAAPKYDDRICGKGCYGEQHVGMMVRLAADDLECPHKAVASIR